MRTRWRTHVRRYDVDLRHQPLKVGAKLALGGARGQVADEHGHDGVLHRKVWTFRSLARLLLPCTRGDDNEGVGGGRGGPRGGPGGEE